MTTMLKLPQPDGYAALTPRGTIVVPPQDFAKHNAYAIYTADQLRTYAAEVWRCAMEAAAKKIEAMRDEHCAATQQAPDPIDHCYADGVKCEFVAAWNDAIAALRFLPVPQQEDAALHPQPQKEQQK